MQTNNNGISNKKSDNTALKIDVSKVFKGGQEVTESEFRGKKYILLYFWATWCGPCRVSAPIIEEISQHFSEELTVLSLTEEGKERLVNFYSNKGWPTYFVGIDNFGRTSERYGVKTIPHFFLLSPDQKIIWRGNPLEVGLNISTLDSVLHKNQLSVSQNEESQSKGNLINMDNSEGYFSIELKKSLDTLHPEGVEKDNYIRFNGPLINLLRYSLDKKAQYIIMPRDSVTLMKNWVSFKLRSLNSKVKEYKPLIQIMIEKEFSLMVSKKNEEAKFYELKYDKNLLRDSATMVFEGTLKMRNPIGTDSILLDNYNMLELVDVIESIYGVRVKLAEQYTKEQSLVVYDWIIGGVSKRFNTFCAGLKEVYGITFEEIVGEVEFTEIQLIENHPTPP